MRPPPAAAITTPEKILKKMNALSRFEDCMGGLTGCRPRRAEPKASDPPANLNQFT
jgi:hypothetical protein